MINTLVPSCSLQHSIECRGRQCVAKILVLAFFLVFNNFFQELIFAEILLDLFCCCNLDLDLILGLALCNFPEFALDCCDSEFIKIEEQV